MLAAEDLRVSFGGVSAVDGASLRVGAGEVVGLVGPNGSGKTTLLNALTGVVDAGGSAWLDDEPLPFGDPGGIRRQGLLRTFQTPQVFADLTCLENALLSTADRRAAGLLGAWLTRGRMWRHERRRWSSAAAALDRAGLSGLADRPAGQLPYGRQRLLGIARALAGAPRVLLMDEPAAGLNDAEVAELATLVARLREEGVALLVVDHRIDFVERISDRIAVLQLGRVIARGSPDEVWDDPAVSEAYLGPGGAGGRSARGAGDAGERPADA